MQHPHYDATPILDARPVRRMRPFWPALIGLALVLGAGAWFVSVARDALDPNAARLRAAEYDARLDQAERLRWIDDTAAAAWKLLPVVLVAGGAFVALAAAWRRYVAHSPDYADVARLRAIHQPGQTPHSLTYSPNLRPGAPLALPPAVDTNAGEGMREAEPFSAYLDRGTIAPGRPLLLGIDAESGDALTGSWLDLYATAVGGLPGTGKTTSQRFYAAQSALHGARFVIVDPHLGASDDSLGATLDPLRACYLAEAASDERAILDAVRLVADIGQRRIKGQDTSRTPVILWVDELTTLLNHSRIGPELAGLLETIAQQFRKAGVYGSYSGQIWSASRSGGDSGFRDSLASVLAHRMKRTQARMLVPTEEARQVERLPIGHAVLWRTSGATHTIAVPNTTAADVQRVAGLLTNDHPTMPRLVPGSVQGSAGSRLRHVATADDFLRTALYSEVGSTSEGHADVTSSAAGRGIVTPETLDPESARILQKFANGESVSEIVRQMAGSTSGRAAVDARERVEAVLRGRIG